MKKITLNAPKNESGPIQMMIMGNYIRQIWVKSFGLSHSGSDKNKNLSLCYAFSDTIPSFSAMTVILLILFNFLW